jgi:hypothetical protein
MAVRPIVEVVPNTGAVYATYLNGFNVLFTSSTDHGATWCARQDLRQRLVERQACARHERQWQGRVHLVERPDRR